VSGGPRPSARGRWGHPAALTIAGSDSGGGAGIQADLKTFQALGVYGMSAITAITAQNTIGVEAVEELSPRIVGAQIDAVAADIGVDGVKTGMLASAPIIRMVAERLRHWELSRVLVVDPVMVAKSGDRLLREDAVRALIEELLPLAAVVTPNIPEAEVLVGHTIETDDDVRAAAREILSFGPRSVVMKGGHRPGDATDLFFDGVRELRLEARRIDTRSTHGTGCTFSAAIVARIALGDELADAVRAAKAYLTAALEHAVPLGGGHGPVAHDWALRRTKA
jgi:hydroxymethylpyrimidine/phosphomethylpyrimidine kinase